MNQPLLTFDDLIRGLESFPKYQALDVFANSVYEFCVGAPVAGLAKISERSYQVTRGDKTFLLEIFPERNVLRVRHVAKPALVVAAATGAAIGAKISDDSLLGALAGGLFGLLIGGAVAGSAGGATRIFTLKFEPESRQWLAYDGGLVPWVKEQLGTGLDLLGVNPKAS